MAVPLAEARAHNPRLSPVSDNIAGLFPELQLVKSGERRAQVSLGGRILG